MDNERRIARGRRARQRIEQRKRREGMVTTATPEADNAPASPRLARFNVPDGMARGYALLQDAWWHLRTHTPLTRALWGGAGVGALMLMLGLFFSPNIGYNVWALGVPLAGMTVNEAQDALIEAWTRQIRLEVTLQGERVREVSPQELGLKIDPYAIAQTARAVGLQGFPFGYDVQPTFTLDEAVAQNLLIDLVGETYRPPFEAGYAWRDGQLVGLMGQSGRELDVFLTLDALRQSAPLVVRQRRLELVMKALPPNVLDPMPYLEQARTFLSQPLTLVGYDPFQDVQTPWTSTQEEITRWLVATPNGLGLRQEAFRQFLSAVNSQLGTETQARYLDERETAEFVNRAIQNGERTVYLRVRYLPSTMTIASGDWGQRISRKAGIPFRLIENVNPGIDWNQLTIGTRINLPSRDELLTVPPVPNKRIVVDLDRRYMVAYENGQVVYHWRISIGRTEAPTYPGIFQVLSHAEKAYGSGFSLCTSTGCSQWEMYWFMGIYEVVPGLMNGFHGAVLLPNGAFLDDGRIGGASTFGCVMASNAEAEALFRWAEKGTVVEIISRDFPPQSALGREAMTFISNVLGA